MGSDSFGLPQFPLQDAETPPDPPPDPPEALLLLLARTQSRLLELQGGLQGGLQGPQPQALRPPPTAPQQVGI